MVFNSWYWPLSIWPMLSRSSASRSRPFSQASRFFIFMVYGPADGLQCGGLHVFDGILAINGNQPNVVLVFPDVIDHPQSSPFTQGIVGIAQFTHTAGLWNQVATVRGFGDVFLQSTKLFFAQVSLGCMGKQWQCAKTKRQKRVFKGNHVASSFWSWKIDYSRLYVYAV